MARAASRSSGRADLRGCSSSIRSCTSGRQNGEADVRRWAHTLEPLTSAAIARLPMAAETDGADSCRRALADGLRLD